MYNIKQINTGVAEVLAVLLPEGSTPIRVERGNMLIVNQDHRPEYDDYIWLPPGNWTPLGIELTEEQCREVMPLYKGDCMTYINNEVDAHDTAKEAFASLMQANGVYSKSPYEKPNRNDYNMTFGHNQTELYRKHLSEWHKAEANTGTWLILKRLS